MTSTYALIPARAGSVRVPGKNVRDLGGKPLIAWTIEAAFAAGSDDVLVSSDSEEIGVIAIAHGAIWIPRPPQYATAESPDIQWVQHALAWLKARELVPDILAILRPTSPFRGGAVVADAIRILELLGPRGHSIRAIRPSIEHPAKTWFRADSPQDVFPNAVLNIGLEQIIAFAIKPVYERPNLRLNTDRDSLVPQHSSPTQTLPAAYVQTAGMEIIWRNIIAETGTISGSRIYGYLLDGPAALDINTEADWRAAEVIAASLEEPVPAEPEPPAAGHDVSVVDQPSRADPNPHSARRRK